MTGRRDKVEWEWIRGLIKARVDNLRTIRVFWLAKYKLIILLQLIL